MKSIKYTILFFCSLFFCGIGAMDGHDCFATTYEKTKEEELCTEQMMKETIKSYYDIQSEKPITISTNQPNYSYINTVFLYFKYYLIEDTNEAFEVNLKPLEDIICNNHEVVLDAKRKIEDQQRCIREQNKIIQNQQETIEQQKRMKYRTRILKPVLGDMAIIGLLGFGVGWVLCQLWYGWQ